MHPRITQAWRLVFAAACLGILGACASTPGDSEWRPIEPADRLISFDAAAFDVQPSVYSGQLYSFSQASEYGVWRDQGGETRYVEISLSHLRRQSRYVFAHPDDPINEVIDRVFTDEILEYGPSRRLNAAMGEFEVMPFRIENHHCAGLRWYGWKDDDWVQVQGAGGQLGKGRVHAFLCDRAQSPLGAPLVAQFANAISVRERKGW